MIPMDLSPIGTCAAIGAARGLYLFPCHSPVAGRCSCRKADCASPAKHPRTVNGLKAATSDVEQVAAWWRLWPEANVAVSCGPSGLYVVDTDGPDATDAWRLLADQYDYDLDPVVKVQTSRGWHYWFKVPTDSTLGNTASLLAPGIDTRGAGGYVFLPPSKHVSGHTYRYETPLDPMAPLPEWVASLVRPQRTERDPKAAARVAQLAPAQGTRLSRYAFKALEDELTGVLNAAESTRNNRLNVGAFNLGQLVGAGLLPEQEVRTALYEAGTGAGLEHAETVKTIESGLTSGMAHPRRVSA